MPYGDGTGPNGMGQRTGRGLGHCNDYNVPGFAGFGRGCGRGLGGGRGRGFGFRNFASAGTRPVYGQASEYTAENELNDLKAEKQEIEKRIKQLEKE